MNGITIIARVNGHEQEDNMNHLALPDNIHVTTIELGDKYCDGHGRRSFCTIISNRNRKQILQALSIGMNRVGIHLDNEFEDVSYLSEPAWEALKKYFDEETVLNLSDNYPPEYNPQIPESRYYTNLPSTSFYWSPNEVYRLIFKLIEVGDPFFQYRNADDSIWFSCYDLFREG